MLTSPESSNLVQVLQCISSAEIGWVSAAIPHTQLPIKDQGRGTGGWEGKHTTVFPLSALSDGICIT